MKKSFTLMELAIVLVIIGILATLALSSYAPARERALGREAIANLKLIAAAEKIYRMETAVYYPPSGTEDKIAAININLKLFVTEKNWDYKITGGRNTFNATAYRWWGPGNYLGCQYYINSTQDEPQPIDPSKCP